MVAKKAKDAKVEETKVEETTVEPTVKEVAKEVSKAAPKKAEAKKTPEKKEKSEGKTEAKDASEDSVSKSLVDQVKEGIIKEKEEKPTQLATPQTSEMIALVHVHASKNNTIITVTDLSGAETLAQAMGGMVAKTGREEKSPFAGGQLAKRVATELKDRGFTKVDVLLRGKGGHRGQKSPGRAASAVIKMLSRSGIKIRKIEDVTPIPHGGCKPPGGKRGRRV